MDAREKQPGKTVWRDTVRRICWLGIVVGAVFIILAHFKKHALVSGANVTQAYTREGMLEIEHNEVVMLAVSLVVLFEVLFSSGFIRRIQHRWVLMCSFGLFVLAAVCTVAEGFCFRPVLIFAKHLSLAGSAILLAVWCGLVFKGHHEQEGG